MSYRRHLMKEGGGIDLSKNWLCFTALEDGTFGFSIASNYSVSYIGTICYSINGKKWNVNTRSSSAALSISIPVKTGDCVYWKGSINRCNNNNENNKFSSTCSYNVISSVNNYIEYQQ